MSITISSNETFHKQPTHTKSTTSIENTYDKSKRDNTFVDQTF